MSKVEVVDENDKVIGVVERKEAHEKGLLHRVAAIYLLNEKGQFLVNERAKDGYLDHSSAGHVEIGESYLEAAKRELFEELGVSGIELEDLGQVLEGVGLVRSRKHIFRVYAVYASPVKLNEGEVKSVYWAFPQDVMKDMEKNPGKYTGGFKVTIKILMNWLKSNGPHSESLEIARGFLGQEVEVAIERPKGSKHPKHGFVYEADYGFIAGTKAPDGEELDAYFLGPNKTEKAKGKCIAIIHRLEDDDDKLVVVPPGTVLTDKEIEEKVAFQENWFKHEIVR